MQLVEILNGDLSGNREIFYNYGNGCIPEAEAELREVGDFPHPEEFGDNYSWTSFCDTLTARKLLAKHGTAEAVIREKAMISDYFNSAILRSVNCL